MAVESLPRPGLRIRLGESARRVPKRKRWAIFILMVILIMGVLVPLVSPYAVTRGSGPSLEPPGLVHWFGTDQLGRDVFTRTFAAVWLDLSIAIVAVSIPLVTGTVIGSSIAVWRGRKYDAFLSMLIEAISALPVIVIVLSVVALVGFGPAGLILAVISTNWARYARIARARALAVRDSEFVAAAQVLGYSRRRILFKHVVPNVAAETVAYALSDIVLIIIVVASVSYLGFGVRPPTAEWGAMIAEGRLLIGRAWWVVVFPGAILSLTAVTFSLIAERKGAVSTG